MRRTPEGFILYGKFKDARGNRIRVQRSCIRGRRRCRLVCEAGSDRAASVAAMFGASAMDLTRRQARRLAKALLDFADGED